MSNSRWGVSATLDPKIGMRRKLPLKLGRNLKTPGVRRLAANMIDRQRTRNEVPMFAIFVSAVLVSGQGGHTYFTLASIAA